MDRILDLISQARLQSKPFVKVNFARDQLIKLYPQPNDLSLVSTGMNSATVISNKHIAHLLVPFWNTDCENVLFLKKTTGEIGKRVMRHDSSRQLFAYWDRIRDARKAPRRDEIEPSDIRNLLSDTFILDISTSYKSISYRLAGTRLCAAFARELKGYGFLCHWSEEDCFEVTKRLSRVYRDFEPQLISYSAQTDTEKLVEYEMVMLPLQSMSDGSIRVLGITTPSNPPYWLGSEPLSICNINSARNITNYSIPPHETPSLSPLNDYGHEIENSSFDSAIDNARQVAHLTVHEGGKE